jgi:hypothetical protein
MHPRQRYAPLKPQIAQLNPNSRFGRGVLGAWLINDDGGIRAASATENYPELILDAGPYSCHVYELMSSPDEMLTVDSPWGQGVYFPTGNYGEIRNDWGKFWAGLTAVSTFAIVRRRTTGALTNILNTGYSSTTNAKLQFDFTSADKLRYGARAGTEGLQNVVSDRTYGANEWFVVGGTARIVNGGGVYQLYTNGVQIASTGTINHSYSAFDGSFGTWKGHLGGLDYTLNVWANVDIVFCMHWGWELTPEDMAGLYLDPYQAFYRPELSRYEDSLTEEQVSYFIVNLAKNTGQNIRENVRTVLVDAPSAQIARDMAESLYEGDADWDDSAATLLEAATDPYAGSRWRIRVSGAPVPSPDIVDVSYTAQAGDDLGAVLDGLVAVLNGPGTPINTASRSGGTLTVAEGSQSYGDRTVTIEITPSGSSLPLPNRVGLPVDTITHQGSAGSGLGISFLDTGLPRILSTG